MAKSDVVYRQMLTHISQMSAGEAFPSVRQWMKTVGVSQAVVQEAMNRLKDEKLISCEVSRGSVVLQDGASRKRSLVYYQPDWVSFSHDLDIHLKANAQRYNFSFRKVLYDVEDSQWSFLDYDNAEAILLAPTGGITNTEQLSRIMNCPVPVVMLRANMSGTDFNYVGGDNTLVGLMAAEYFSSLGHTNVGLVNSEPHCKTAEEIMQSFIGKMEDAGGKVRIFDCKVKHGEIAALKTFEVMKTLLSKRRLQETALFSMSDPSAMGIYKALLDSGYLIPEDVSVLGFGGDDAGALYSPALTTVAISREKMAVKAFELLKKCLDSGEMFGHQLRMYPELIIRSSTTSAITRGVNSITA